MRAIITTNRSNFKVISGRLSDISESYCHYAFGLGGGLPCAKGLENKAFSRAAAVDLGEFTPNMGYPRWDLGRVDLVDPRQDAILAPLYPLDKNANADGRRAFMEADAVDTPAQQAVAEKGKKGTLPPLLRRLLQEYSATGLPPAYLPKTPPPCSGESS